MEMKMIYNIIETIYKPMVALHKINLMELFNLIFNN